MMDERAQSHGLIVFFVTIIAGALLYTLFQPAADGIFQMALEQSTHQEADAVVQERQRIFGYMLFYVLFVAGLFLLARSVVQSRSPG